MFKWRIRNDPRIENLEAANSSLTEQLLEAQAMIELLKQEKLAQGCTLHSANTGLSNMTRMKESAEKQVIELDAKYDALKAKGLEALVSLKEATDHMIEEIQ
jgi:hypothetical protein